MTERICYLNGDDLHTYFDIVANYIDFNFTPTMYVHCSDFEKLFTGFDFNKLQDYQIDCLRRIAYCLYGTLSMRKFMSLYYNKLEI